MENLKVVLEALKKEEAAIAKECVTLGDQIDAETNKRAASTMLPDLYTLRGKFDGIKRAQNILMTVMLDILENKQ